MADLKIKPVRFRLSFETAPGNVLFAREYNTDGTMSFQLPEVGQLFEIRDTTDDQRFSGTGYELRPYLEIDASSIGHHITITLRDSQVITP